MMRALEVVAVAALALAAKHILQYIARKHGCRERHEALQTWEAEGGAVPTSRTRTAGQLAPAPDALSASALSR